MPGVAIVAVSVSTMTLILVLAWSRDVLVLPLRILAGYRRTLLVMLTVMPRVMA